MFNQFSFQDGKSYTMMAISEFHDYALTALTFILVLVGSFTMVTTLYNPYSIMNLGEGLSIEMAWTAFPSIILIALASSSLWLLYELETHVSSNNCHSISLKTTGHQWYWSYDYADYNNLEFNAYMISPTDLHQGQFRLLETDNRLVVPWNSPIRMYISSSDVLHSWTVPSLGVKADAIPGRLNLIELNPNFPGTYYGQCSEICGANHSFMPISMEVVAPYQFNSWATLMSSHL